MSRIIGDSIYITNGNIGIGTTIPAKSLDIIGDINCTGIFYQNGSLFNPSSQWITSGVNISYTDGNVGIGTTATSLGKLVVAGNIIPNSNNAYNLGSSNLRWRDLYLSGNTIDLDGTTITKDRTTGGIHIGSTNYQYTSNQYARYISTTSNVILPSSIGTINGVNITALNKRTHTSYAAAKECVNTWTGRYNSVPNNWSSVCWSPELSLFCAVSSQWIDPTQPRIMISSDGIAWTYPSPVPTSASNNQWKSICWAPELSLFCAVADSGVTSNLIMTSSNGINWTPRSCPNASLKSVCWSPELSLFCAVGSPDLGDIIITSSDGISWKDIKLNYTISLKSICWSPELSLFCAISPSAKNLISSDGINWTSNTTISGQFGSYWSSVCWSPELSLFCAVGSVGFKPDIMTSPNGINWTARTSPPNNNYWESVCWAPEISLFCAVAGSTSPPGAQRVMTSPDGINWTSANANINNSCSSVCWSPELSIFCVLCQYIQASGVVTSGIAMPNAKSVVKALPTQMIVNTNGNVGIGTTVSRGKLEISGFGGRFDNLNSLLLNNTAPNSTARGISIDFRGYSLSNQLTARIQSTNGINGNYSGTLKFYTGNPIGSDTYSISERMIIDESGNIGIGTTNPQAKLDIIGNCFINNYYILPTYLYDGSSINRPALSGWHLAQLKTLYNLPLTNGYYYIKSPNMPNALQMYVNFTADGGGYDFYRFTSATSIDYVFKDHGARSLGLDIFYPRSKSHWVAIYDFVVNVNGSTIANDVKTTGAVYRDKTSAPNGTGGFSATYTSYIMRDPRYYSGGAPDWQVPDGGKWFLRDTTYSEPNGDYYFYGFLTLFSLASDGTVVHNDGNAGTLTGTTIICSTNVKGSSVMFF